MLVLLLIALALEVAIDGVSSHSHFVQALIVRMVWSTLVVYVALALGLRLYYGLILLSLGRLR